MEKRRYSLRPSLFSPTLLLALALWVCVVPPPAVSQAPVRLGSQAQKSDIIAEVARLLEANYHLPDRAGAFAQGLLARHSAGEYARFTEGSEFASAATAALDSLFLESERVGLLSEFFVDILSYNYFSPEDGKILLAILEKKAVLFPSSLAQESLGMAHQILGNDSEALGHYEKALELDPASRNVAKRIERLRKRR